LSDVLNELFFHWSPDKALWIGTHTLSWDARCAGIHIGFGMGIVWHLIVGRKAGRLPPFALLIPAGLLLVPLFADILSLHYGMRLPSNDWKFLTGLTFGQAASVFLYPAFVTLAVTRREDRAALTTARGFGGLLLLDAAAFLAKSPDSVVAYYVLEFLGIFGNVSLLFVVIIGALVALIGPRSPSTM
jgi:uncharacterized membrane protein